VQESQGNQNILSDGGGKIQAKVANPKNASLQKWDGLLLTARCREVSIQVRPQSYFFNGKWRSLPMLKFVKG
jgi:hypothetical protein